MQDDQLLGQMRTKQTTLNYNQNSPMNATADEQVLSPVPRHLQVNTGSAKKDIMKMQGMK